jgi:hypothetical protein
VRVGMSTADFYQQFFTLFPVELQQQYKVVVFDNCVDSIKHTYDFKNGKLVSVKFSEFDDNWRWGMQEELAKSGQ